MLWTIAVWAERILAVSRGREQYSQPGALGHTQVHSSALRYTQVRSEALRGAQVPSGTRRMGRAALGSGFEALLGRQAGFGVISI